MFLTLRKLTLGECDMPQGIFYWNPMKHGKHRAEFLKKHLKRLKFKAVLLNSKEEKGQLRPHVVK